VYRTARLYTSAEIRTNIEVDDELIREALPASGLKTKRAAVEAGLKALIRLNRQKKILDLAGKVHWEGNWTRAAKAAFLRDPCR
jgi:Arc/MetJ family transcription regulator